MADDLEEEAGAPSSQIRLRAASDAAKKGLTIGAAIILGILAILVMTRVSARRR